MADPAGDAAAEGNAKAAITAKVDPLKHFPVEHDIPPRKILFLGDSNIGKTTFIQKYCEHVASYYRCFGYNGPSWVFTQFLLYHRHDEKRVLLRFMDFPSTTIEESRKNQYPGEVDAIVLCFAIDSPKSLENVGKIWLPESKNCYPNFGKFYLLGLRNDKREEISEANTTSVTLKEGFEIHQKYKFCGEYMECTVEENPQQSFELMKTLINNVLSSEPASE